MDSKRIDFTHLKFCNFRFYSIRLGKFSQIASLVKIDQNVVLFFQSNLHALYKCIHRQFTSSSFSGKSSSDKISTQIWLIIQRVANKKCLFKRESWNMKTRTPQFCFLNVLVAVTFLSTIVVEMTKVSPSTLRTVLIGPHGFPLVIITRTPSSMKTSLSTSSPSKSEEIR